MNIPKNTSEFSLENTNDDNYFNNSLDIEFPNFFQGVDIQGFKSYQDANASSNYSHTYLNMSDIGTIINMCRLLATFLSSFRVLWLPQHILPRAALQLIGH